MELTPETTPNTLGDWAYIAINKHYKKITKHELEVLKDNDPEELHQMRVGMRRLRSAIIGFSPAVKLPNKSQEKKIGKVAKVLGELRDLDVLKEILETEYKPHLPKEEKDCLNLAIASLKKQRKRTFEKVKNLLSDSIYQQLKQGFIDWLEHPNYTPIAQFDIDTILPDLLLPRISQLLLHSGWLVGVNLSNEVMTSLSSVEVESLLNLEGILLHDLRKEAKRCRYNMELFTQFYGENYQNYLDSIKEVQSVLGDIQDSFVLGKFLRKTLESEKLKKMPTLNRILIENRWQKWQEWQTLQQIFLNPESRKEFHQLILSPLTV